MTIVYLPLTEIIWSVAETDRVLSWNFRWGDNFFDGGGNKLSGTGCRPLMGMRCNGGGQISGTKFDGGDGIFSKHGI